MGTAHLKIKKTRKNGQPKRAKMGYTLVEAIMSVLIIALIALAISSGLSAATSVYEKSLFSSNSMILEDTINASISDVLRFAKEVDATTGDTVHFSNSQYGSITSTGYIGEKDGYLYVYENDLDSGKLLVNTGSYDDMDVADFQMTYDEASKTFSGTYNLTDGNGELLKKCSFAFKTLAE